ncbi:winged helix-turn-helix transcriptional regulator [Haloarcula amylolytica]|uniref:winged helix-turn-helix transcriptional regulator n=1 Tax=Haloarcula amylolytica TaxID=396317 RepID=UPI003C788F90
MDQIELENQLDRKDRRFINVVHKYEEATTTDIRQRTGLSRSEVNHRFKKLSELDLIDVSYANEGKGNRQPPKVATLTGRSRSAIERGILRKIDQGLSDEEIDDLRSEVRELREQVNSNTNRLDVISDSIQTLESTVSDLDDDIEHLYEYSDAVKQSIIDIRNHIGLDY